MAQSKIGPDKKEEELNNTKQNQSNTRVSGIFDSIIFAMKVTGVFPMNKETTSRFIYVLHAIYCCLIQLLGVYGAFRYFAAFFVGGKSGKYRFHVGLLSIAWFFLSVCYLCVSSLLSSKHIRHMCKSFDEYEKDYGIHFSKRKYKRIYDILAISFLIWTILTQTFGCLIFGLRLLNTESVFIYHLWPFQDARGTPYILAILMYLISAFPVTANGTGLCTLYFIVLACVKKEFQNVTQRVQNLESCDTISIATGVEDIRQQHQAIVRLLSSANLFLRHIAGGFYAIGIPTICLLIYGVSTGSLFWEDALNTVWSIILNLLVMFAITFTGAKVSSTAHEPLEELHNLDTSNLSQKVISQIALFSNRLSGPTIGVDVYGLFVIDYSTVLMIFGTLITYAVIAVQFTSSCQNCDMKTFNGTNSTMF